MGSTNFPFSGHPNRQLERISLRPSTSLPFSSLSSVSHPDFRFLPAGGFKNTTRASEWRFYSSVISFRFWWNLVVRPWPIRRNYTTSTDIGQYQSQRKGLQFLSQNAIMHLAQSNTLRSPKNMMSLFWTSVKKLPGRPMPNHLINTCGFYSSTLGWR